jgi:hypothetical protein
MLWRKNLWETRWILLTILAVMILLAVLKEPWDQPDLTRWAAWVQQTASSWGKRRPSQDETQFLTLLSAWPGYVWWNWFQSLMATWPLMATMMTAALIQSSCPRVGTPGAAIRFTFSLPVSRRKALLTQAAFVAIVMSLCALVPSLIYPIMIRLTGGWFPLRSAVIYSLLLAIGGMVFIAFAFLMMVIFNNHRIVMALGILAVFAPVPILFPLGLRVTMLDEFPWWHIYHVMSGETYFRYGRIPWPGLFASLALSALMTLAAVRIYERRDF